MLSAPLGPAKPTGGFCRDAAPLRVTPPSWLGSALLCQPPLVPQPSKPPLLHGEPQPRCFLGPFRPLCSPLPLALPRHPQQRRCPPSQPALNLLPALLPRSPLSSSAPQLVKGCQHSPAVSSAPNKAPFSPCWLLGSGSWARRELCPLIAFLSSEGCAGEQPRPAALSIYTLRGSHELRLQAAG